jgi:hypothetical protein
MLRDPVTAEVRRLRADADADADAAEQAVAARTGGVLGPRRSANIG